MAIGGLAGGWNNNSPANSDNAGLGDDEIRSMKSNLQGPLDSEHNWPAAGGAAVGFHRYGSARPYVGTPSQVSSDGTDGRLMVDTGNVAWSLTSLTPNLMGHPAQLFNGWVSTVTNSSFSAPPKFGNKFLMGAAVTNGGSGTTFVSFGGSAYSGAPHVMLSPIDVSFGFRLVSAIGSGFTVQGFNTSTLATGSGLFNWVSIGTCSLGVS